MKYLLDLKAEEAKIHFLKSSSYWKEDLPNYIDFGPLLINVFNSINGEKNISYGENPKKLPDVNYEIVANKDGRFNWRPFELIHPALYANLINIVCSDDNWKFIQEKFSAFSKVKVECCSLPVVADVDGDTDNAEQVRSWWIKVEQRSLELSLQFSHMVQTDVTNCYGTLYTHSISWALHGFDEAKEGKADKELGDQIDRMIRAGRYGQTNGIPQGPQIMDLVAEIVLGYVDTRITNRLSTTDDFRILRYRDDYRIFANSDAKAELILKIIADELRHVGMRLGANKTHMSTNVVESSIKSEKLAAINLQDLGDAQAKTIQKQLLRIHEFGRQNPHSGQLRRLLSDFHKSISKNTEKPDDLAVQVAITSDIGLVSPSSFPAVAAILSHLISLSTDPMEKERLWHLVREKMRRVPKNGYLDIWLQRVIQSVPEKLAFESEEAICRLVNGEEVGLWESGWVQSKAVKDALDPTQIVVSNPAELPEKVPPAEIALFAWQAEQY